MCCADDLGGPRFRRWQHLDDGLLLARQPRVDWATLLRRTFAEDVLSCPRCRGRMALIEVLTDEAEIRRSLTKLGLSCPGRRSLGEGDEPVSFAPPRDADDPPRRSSGPTSTRGRPIPADDLPDGADPSPTDDFRDPPWQEHCRIPVDDDALQVPPDAEI
jgi:hypothetical protein